jgi:hypothetical protein
MFGSGPLVDLEDVIAEQAAGFLADGRRRLSGRRLG